uniref:Uncharacterized protein n=1 Tax=Arundo donax TaxID=35708 RepID=A0A0A9DLV2_ARUDO
MEWQPITRPREELGKLVARLAMSWCSHEMCGPASTLEVLPKEIS